MKSIVILCAFLLFSGSFLHLGAQPPAGDMPGPPPESIESGNTPESIAELQTKWMKKKLKLNPEQFKEAVKINDRYVKKVLAAAGPDAGNLKKKADTERDEALRKMLTPKQFSRYVKNKTVLDNGFENSGYNSIPPPPPGGM